jgi:hypothetical protein
MPAGDITTTQLFQTTGGGTVSGDAITPPAAVLAGTNDGLAVIAWALDALFRGYAALNPSMISRSIKETTNGKVEITYSLKLTADSADVTNTLAANVDQFITS